jgi:peptide/nickel transport system substrate-binding protein
LVVAAVVAVVAVVAAGTALILRLAGSESVVLRTPSGYVEGVAGTWQRVNPLYATTNDVDGDLSQLVFSGLVRVGPDGSISGDLADPPEVSADGKAYTFHIRKQAAWHDGAPVTSADVAFTIAQLEDPSFKGDPALAEAWNGVEVETPDAATVILKLKQASGPFLARNATLGILPEHLLGGLSAQALFEAPFNAKPVGSGPYKLDSLDSREAVLNANERYHLGRPQIGTLRVRFFTDYASATRALSAGELNGLMVRDTVTEAQLTELTRAKGMKVEQLQRPAYVVLYLNNDQTAFFADEQVRRALSLAIDRKAIVDKVFLGVATPSSSAVAPGIWAYTKEYDTTGTDIAEAKKLLEAAGWKPHPTSGILVREGAEFRFTIRTDNDPVRVAIAGEIAKQLEQLGIRATVASTTFSVLRRDFLQERRYDAAVAGWDQGPDPDPYFGWHSSQQGTAGLNIANFGDVVVDDLIAKGRTSNNPEVRKEAYLQFQEKWNELAPSVVLAYPRYVYVHTDSLKGFVPGVLANPAGRFFDIQKWHM